MDFTQILLIFASVLTTTIIVNKFFPENEISMVKRMAISIGLAFLTMTTFNLIFGVKKEQQAAEIRRGEFVEVASSIEDYSAAIHNEIMLDQPANENKIEEIDGYKSVLLFSQNGGCLTDYTFYKTPCSQSARCLDDQIAVKYDLLDKVSELPFFVGLNTNTPVSYSCISREITDENSRLVYQAENENALINKEFLISKKDHSINFSLTITPKKEGLQARIFMPAPLEKNEQGIGNGFIFNDSNKFVRMDNEKAKIAVKPPVVGVQGTYFVNAILQDDLVRRAYLSSTKNDRTVVALETPLITEKSTWNVSAYVGPREYESLKAADPRLTQVLEYGFFSTISGIMLKILNFLYGITHNYGYSILLLALAIGLVFLPFSYSARGSAAKREEFQKKYKYINERYKDDADRRALEQAELVKKYGVFPGGMGCLPVLAQIPLFSALNNALRGSILFYHEPFIFWIRDLSKPDAYYILPILFLLVVYLQMARVFSAKQKFVAIIVMGIFFSLVCQWSAGLLLFLLASALVRFFQSAVLKV